MNHKRDTGGNIKNIGDVFCFLELICSCAKNLQKVEHLEEYSPTFVWIEEEVQPTIQKIIDMIHSTLAVMYLKKVDKTVVEFKRIAPDESGKVDYGDIWMITAMSMMIDDIMSAVRDSEKKAVLQPLEDAILKLQREIDGGDLVDMYDDANEFVKKVSKVMRSIK